MRQISFECTESSEALIRENGKLQISKILDAYKEFSKLIILDGEKHTNEIKMLTGNHIQEGLTVIGPGVDGVIVFSSRMDQNFTLITPLADCGGISFKNKDGTVFGFIHAGYKGVAQDIVGELIENKLWRTGTYYTEFKFHISPMLGRRYEFGTDKYHETFSDLFQKYGLNPEDYFKKVTKEKGYLNLKQIILDIFEFYKVYEENIYDENKETNNPKNSYASYRLHSIAGKIKKKMQERYGDSIEINQQALEQAIEDGINFNRQERELIKSTNYNNYTIDARNLFIVNVK